MAETETRIPLNFPPGLHHTGTKTQAAGRWYDANGVRFYRGNVQPIGGWVQRTTTGATISGRPNAAVSWATDTAAFLAIGTTTGLYVVDSSNVVYDIMATSLSGGTPYQWQLSTFGSYLIAVYALTAYNGSDSLNVLVWTGDTGTRATQAFDGGNGPTASYGVFTTPERFLVVLRGSDPNGSYKRAPTGGAIFDPVGGTGGGIVIFPGAGGQSAAEGDRIVRNPIV